MFRSIPYAILLCSLSVTSLHAAEKPVTPRSILKEQQGNHLRKKKDRHITWADEVIDNEETSKSKPFQRKSKTKKVFAAVQRFIRNGKLYTYVIEQIHNYRSKSPKLEQGSTPSTPCTPVANRSTEHTDSSIMHKAIFAAYACHSHDAPRAESPTLQKHGAWQVRPCTPLHQWEGNTRDPWRIPCRVPVLITGAHEVTVPMTPLSPAA